MFKNVFTCPMTIGEYNTIIKNEKVYEQMTHIQKETLFEFFYTHKEYNIRNVVLQIKDGMLYIITNTKNQ